MRTTILGVIAAIAVSVGAEPSTRPQESLSRARGLMITRVVMSTEAGISTPNGPPEWRDLSEVMKWATDPNSGYYLRELATAKTVDSSIVIVLDYTLQLTRSDDKMHFQISLSPTVSPAGDRPSWFCDDRGVIYTGKPID